MHTIQKIIYLFKLIKSFVSSYRSSFILAVLLGLLNGISGSMGVGVIIPLFSLFYHNTVAGTDFITKATASLFSIAHVSLTPPSLIAFMIILFSLKGLAQFLSKYNTERITAHFEEDMRKDLFSKTLKADWSYLLNQQIGHLERMLSYDSSQATSILLQIGTSILILTSFIAYSFVAFNISATITLVTLLFGAILLPALKPLFFKVRKLSGQISLLYKLVAHHVEENILGAKIVKVTGTEDKVIERGAHYFEELRSARVKQGLYSYAVGSSIEPIGVAFIGVLFIVSYRTPGFNIVSFGVVVYLIQKMFSFIQQIQGQIQTFVSVTPNIENVIAYQKATVGKVEANFGTNSFVFQKSLAFDRVSFFYNEDSPILDNISFLVEKGQMIGIVGPSGAGKTTLVDLLLRLFEPKKGQILLDDIPLSNVDIKDWRKHVGYVPQDIFLLNDTIENNIRFYDQSISKEEIIHATKMANIYDFIDGLPDRFDMVVGERGIKLSGGQRQRIVLARALARKPDILILDEATSAIDVESEKLIQEAIYGLKKKITIIIIAHRLSTVTNSDKIIVIDSGRVVEQGVPGDLLKNENSYFYKLNHPRN